MNLKKRLAKGETLDDILPEAFAVCREASSRVLGMKHYRVQLYWWYGSSRKNCRNEKLEKVKH